MRPFRFDIHRQGVDRFVKIAVDLLRSDRCTRLEVAALATCAAVAWCAA